MVLKVLLCLTQYRRFARDGEVSSDPLSYGSYSHVRVGSYGVDYEILAESVNNRLSFLLVMPRQGNIQPLCMVPT